MGPTSPSSPSSATSVVGSSKCVVPSLTGGAGWPTTVPPGLAPPTTSASDVATGADANTPFGDARNVCTS